MSQRQTLDLNTLLPQTLKNETLVALTENLFNRFVSEEQSVNVSGRIGQQVDGEPQIKAANLDRELNSLIPVLHYKAGAEDHVLTFADMINRARALNIDLANMRQWMAEQHFNFTPPITFDKFVNYSNYYWINNSTSWNENSIPEYYVIARPADDSALKLDVKLATTQQINFTHANRDNETITLEFVSSTSFSISGSQNSQGAIQPNVYSLVSNVPGEITTVSLRAANAAGETAATPDGPLCMFSITNGQVSFSLGDKFEISIEYGTSNISASFTSPFPVGKGGVSGIVSTSLKQWIDGVQISEGDRILVKDQTDAVQNGIYTVVSNGKIVRSSDANTDDKLPIGTTVFVTHGDTQADSRFELTSSTASGGTDDVSNLNTFTEVATSTVSIINEWQAGNNWYHFDELMAQGVSVNNATQALRPIIEYDSTLQLNSSYDDNGQPFGDNEYTQTHAKINQIPQFDLFYYDGTPSHKTSAIFFYVEDPDYPVDEHLLKRAKTTADADYVFGVGIVDEQGRQLYFKTGSTLSTTWAAGVDGAEAYSIKVTGQGNGSVIVTPADLADNQDWTLTFTSNADFRVTSSRSGDLGMGQIDVQFSSEDGSFIVNSGSEAFAEGSIITWSVANRLSPRYVKKVNDAIVNEFTNVDVQETDKTWLVPLRMFQNVDRRTEYQFIFGDLLNHMRSVIKEQDGFEGSSFGKNNTYQIPFDASRGGAIRDFSGNFPLFASMLFQEQISPITIIEFAEQQYISALSSIDQFLVNDFANYLANHSAVAGASIDPYSAEILELFAAFELGRSTDQILKDVYQDTTSGITNWPVTLPQIGMLTPVEPGIKFDNELGIDVIVHHDGHVSPIAGRDVDFDRELVKTIVKRSDGTYSAGVFSELMPSTPYARQLWMKPSVLELKVFDVDYDTADAPIGKNDGEVWFNRTTGDLFVWANVSNSWVAAPFTVASRWIVVTTENIRNSLILQAEFKLYDSIHSSLDVTVDLSTVENSEYAEAELARYAGKYQLDVFAPNYDATDAFTWNYSQAVVTGLAQSPARWFDVYKEYFAQYGQPTCRPNLEPWKLLGFNEKPVTWDAMYASTVAADENNRIDDVVAVSTIEVPLLFGLTSVDGVPLNNGDRVLLVAQNTTQLNGVYIASSGAWARSTDVLEYGTTVSVLSGLRASSTWSITSSNPINIGISPIIIEQVRPWSDAMWSYIKSVHPTLKVGVNIYTDELLAPYSVNSEAVVSSIPPDANAAYVFGDNGPGELAWKKSTEYNYGLARSLFKLDPMNFLDNTWGDTYVSSAPGQFRLERNICNTLAPHKFLMHGERLHIQNAYSADQVKARLTGSLTSTGGAHFQALVACVGNNKTVFDLYVDGTFAASVEEGSPITFTLGNVTAIDLVIEDLGIPYSLNEQLSVTFFDDIVDPNFVPPVAPALELGCEGCVSPDEPDAVVIYPTIPVEPVYNHIPAAVKKFVGLGQLYTNLLRYSYIDTDVSKSTLAYRGWEAKLGHRFGALIREDSLKIKTALGNLPTTAYDVLLKKSPNTQSLWISGLRIQLVEMGAKVLNEFGILVPKTDGSDWKFRIESYNPQNPSLEYYVLDTSAEYQTFYALQQRNTPLEWKHFTEKINLSTLNTPVTITGLQNVVNIVYGYVDRLTELGWSVNEGSEPVIDAETGRSLDWQLEIEKLIDRVYSGMDAGEGHILNPFMEALWLKTPIGLMATYASTNFVDVYSSQAAVDVTGTIIPISNLHVTRTDAVAVTRSSTPIFAAHVFIDQYEHLLLMNKKFSDETNASIAFSPFLGLRITSAYLDYTRHEVQNGKPTFDGFFISGDKVVRNITSSIQNISNFYDPTLTFGEQDTSKHALSLLGYTPKSYFDDLTTSDVTQFNFWRGLIQAKGTNLTVDAFVNYKRFASAGVDEYWAYKLAEFGDARERTFPEVKINTQDCSQKFTRLQFYSSADANYSPIQQYIQIENNDDTRWYSIDDLSKGLRFEASHISETVVVPNGTVFPAYIRLANVYHNGDVGDPTVSAGEMVNASLLKVNAPGEYNVSGFTWTNPAKLSPIKLFDYKESTLIAEIPLWHPAIGLHSPEALEVVNMISDNDPANYNYSTKTINNPNFKHLKPWGDKEVGRVWWDTSNLAYVPYYDAEIFASRDARHARWGALAEWASVNLYEWTESSVHPSEYDTLALSEEGRADIPRNKRASGKAALKKFYKRNRVIYAKPIAWSQNGGRMDVNLDPSLSNAENVKVFAVGTALILDKGSAEQTGFVSGKRFAAWKDSKPYGEVTITGDTVYDIGSSTQVNTPNINVSPVFSDVAIKLIENNQYGYALGQLNLSKIETADGFWLRSTLQDGSVVDILISDWNALSTNDTVRTVSLDRNGVELVLNRTSTGVILASDVVDAIIASITDVYVREGVRFEELLPLPDFIFINDQTDPDYWSNEYEYRMWDVPAQSQLSSDLLPPHNTWLPIIGEDVEITATTAVAKAMADSTNTFNLKTGFSIARYTSVWTNWEELQDVKIEQISNGHDALTFILADVVDTNRLSLYANGVQINPLSISVNGNAVSLTTALSEGTSVMLLYRAYQPSEEELGFDPDVEDDFTIQIQYKGDFQFTKVDVRDAAGNISSSKYYFWATDKTIPATDKNMSLQQAQLELQNGPSMYAMFSRMVDEVVPAFDSCAIAGLSNQVTKNNAYKLRFLRNFTLKDDPEEMDLKNVHTEWVLLRKGQSNKIPKQLWDVITNAVCGQDESGQQVPSRVRVDYDVRNGTRSRYGFGKDQIFADTTLVVASITNAILNTTLTINLGPKVITDYITALDLNKSEQWFATPESARNTMNLIWSSARPRQINEIFFAVLDDALASNYEFSDIFKTSLITVNSTTNITPAQYGELADDIY